MRLASETISRFSPTLSLGILLAAILPALPAKAQGPKNRTIPFEGVEVVCHILQDRGLQPIQKIERELLVPSQTMIVVFGKPRILDEIEEATGGLEKYLQHGGSLLVATDYPFHPTYLPIAVDGEKVLLDPAHSYKGNFLECPFLHYPEPLLFGLDDEREHPLFLLLHKGIATNCPSFLRAEKNAPLRSLLEFPSVKGARKLARSYMIASPKRTPPKGRALYLAGHGMFMNGMMLQSDSDNFEFTVNAVQWLRDSKQGYRFGALFVVDGKIVTDFAVNLSRPPPLPTVTMLNRLLRGLEDERRFHQVLASLLDANRAVALLLGIGTFIFLLYGIKKFMEGRYHGETSVPLLAGPAAANGPRVPLFQQRLQDLIRRDNYSEESRWQVRDWFRKQFGLEPETWIAGATGARQFQTVPGSPSSLRHQSDYVLSLACAIEPIKVTRRDFLKLTQALPHLELALREKRLALLVEGKKVRQLQD